MNMNDLTYLQQELDELKRRVFETSIEIGNSYNNNINERELLAVTTNSNLAFVDFGNTAWVMICSILVLFMTLPGLVLFFSGMIREKNVLAACMQVFSIVCIISVLWICFGYSIAFAPATAHGQQEIHGYTLFGDGSRIFMQGITAKHSHNLAPTIPENIFAFFQLGFAVITPALIVGSYVDRMKYSATLLFVSTWHLIVYCPVCHIIWHPNGLLYGKSMDFAGGLVVHMTSGIAGLVSCIVIGPRKGFQEGHKFENTSILYTFMGASFLWFGWFGFNGGSAYEANYLAAHSLINTQVCCCVAAFSWMATEYFIRKKPSVLGMVNGAVAGLVASAPLAGFSNIGK